MQIYLYQSTGETVLEMILGEPQLCCNDYIISQGPASYDLWPKSSLLPVVVNQVLYIKCKAMPIHLYIFDGTLHTTTAELRSCDKHCMACKPEICALCPFH